MTTKYPLARLNGWSDGQLQREVKSTGVSNSKEWNRQECIILLLSVGDGVYRPSPGVKRRGKTPYG